MKMISLPEWYYNSDNAITVETGQAKRNLQWARKSLASIGEVLAGELSGVNRADSWLSNIEPRSKILGLLALVVFATTMHNILSISILFSLALSLAISSGLTIKRLGRWWLGVPLFNGLIILPAVLNIVTPGTPALVLWSFEGNVKLGLWHLPSVLTITYSGLFVASRFFIRSVTCITLIAVLTNSTDSSTLINAMRRLGMPKVFGMTLVMMQRYMSLILLTAEKIHLAKLSRTISSRSLRNEQRWAAAGIGMLFRRTCRLAEEVRQAMVSRGYDGDLQVRYVISLRSPDFFWIAGVFMALLGLLLIDHLV